MISDFPDPYYRFDVCLWLYPMLEVMSLITSLWYKLWIRNDEFMDISNIILSVQFDGTSIHNSDMCLKNIWLPFYDFLSVQ